LRSRLSAARAALGRFVPAAREAVRRFVRAAIERNVLEAAGSVAFRLFLSAVPLFVFAGYVLGILARRRGVDALLEPLAEVLPTPTLAIVRDEVRRLAEPGSVALAPLSMAGFLWLTSSGAHNLLNVFAMVFRVRKRPWWRQRLHALGWTLLALVLAVCAGWARVTVDLALHPAGSHPIVSMLRPSSSRSRPWVRRTTDPDASTPTTDAPRYTRNPDREASARRWLVRSRSRRSFTENALTFLVLLNVGVAVLTAFYRYSVDVSPRPRGRAWPGALVAILAWLVVSYAFGRWITALQQYTVYYGSLAAVAVLQLWLYVTALVLLLGGLFNAQLEGDVETS
jgi:membrane protein